MASWSIKNTKGDFAEIARQLCITEMSARLIVNRGIKTYEEARQFLNPSIESLQNPFKISHMDKAVKTVKHHMEKGFKIAIYGDYDVDGVMSAVILYKALNYKNLVYYVPDREEEGYGLNIGAIDKLCLCGVSLIIACDNGIAALKESRYIYECGMELVIIDHHEPPYDKDGNDILPLAEAIVNPKKQECTYPFKLMCAAGLCYRFALALSVDDDDELLIFAAIATICDIVDLIGDNRIIAKNGLEKFLHTENIGLKALINLYGLTRISAYHIGFIIGPAINASGRLENARLAFDLFITDNADKALALAKKLYSLNTDRKELTEGAYNELSVSLPETDKVYVLYSENVHESVAGIVAGRIKEKFNHPAAVITNGKDCAKGSARSISGYNIFDALTNASHLLIKYGGHAAAAGFSIPYENIDAFRKSLNDYCKLTDFAPKLVLEARLPIDEITFELAGELNHLAPFGKGNKEPVFAEKGVKFSKVNLLGKDKRIIKLYICGYSLTAIAFDLYDKFLEIAKEHFSVNEPSDLNCLTAFELDIAFTVSVNEFRGERSLQLILKDIRK